MICVNFSTPNYALGQKRLAASLNGYKKLMLNDYVSIGSPSHKDSPYQFKIHAIEAALKLDDIVLWCDASLWRVGDLKKIEDIIINEGFFGEESGHYCYDWANQHCREWHNLKKEEGLIMYSAGLTGLNRNSPIAMEFLKQWKASALAGCFIGSYENHRHDMVNASIIASRLGLKFQRGGSHLSYVGPGYSQPEEGTVFYLQGL